MKRKITDAVIAANRKNGRKGGPRTPQGKSHSKLNAIITGFFAGELVLNDEEKGQLEAIRRALQPELWPQTVLQWLGFGRILTCIGRCKLALRQEMHRVRRMFAEAASQQTQSEQSGGPVVATNWYSSGRQGLRGGMRLVQEVKAGFENLGRIDPNGTMRWTRRLAPGSGNY
jgi:hypothetical protein